MPTTENICKTADHTTFYLADGPADGPLIIFVHGWPELSLSWRHQLRFFADMGFRAIAPDMRGYGHSTVYNTNDAYRQELIVGDMLALLDHLGRDQAVWVGHDWGSPVAWNLASHHPEKCAGVASLCVPYASVERGLDWLKTLVDRDLYPEDQYPYGQWDYMRYYEENFEQASNAMDANPTHFVNLLFRRGSPEGEGKPSGTSTTRASGGWFGGASEIPYMPPDTAVVSPEEASVFAAALTRNGFFGPDSWYVNHAANAEYFGRAVNDARLDMPCLFLHASYDYVCYTVKSRLADPMRELCNDLTEETVHSGHWMAQEQPAHVNRYLARWLASRLPALLD